jgi:acetyl esterase
MALLPDVQRFGLRLAISVPRVAQRSILGAPATLDGRQLDPEMHALVRLMALGASGMERTTGSSTRSRKAFVVGAQTVGGRQPIGAVTDRSIEGPGGRLKLRFYTPAGVDEATPGLVFLHGGGFLRGNLDSHDAPCRVIAERAQVRVISVDYRLAPEHPFPAAVDDAVAAWRWVNENAESLDVLANVIAIGGDSAGGNLAAVVAQEMVRSGGPVPTSQLLMYPPVDFVETWPSRTLFAEGFLLTDEFIDMADEAYLVGDEDRADPRLSPLKGDMTGLPPTVITTAGFDPLRDQGEAYAHALKDAGVRVEHIFEPNLVHGYLNMTGYGSSAPAAIDRAIAAFQRSLI